MLRGMLLDIDGTLLLSNDAHAQAWVDVYKEFGYDIPFETVHPLIGMGGDKLMAKVTPDLNESEGIGKKIASRRKEIFLQLYAPRLQPSPGGRNLLQRLKELGVTLTIATSAKDDELETLLKAARIDDLIENTTTSDDAKQSKPEPDIIHAALEKAQLGPDDVLMLGDTPYDIEAARKSGVGTIAVRCGGHDEDLTEALAVYDDPADLLTHLDESPIGQELRHMPVTAGSSTPPRPR